MPSQRIGGIISIKVNGIVQLAAGEFTFHDGSAKLEGVAGVDAVHGYVEKPQVPYLEGTITDRRELDFPALKAIRNGDISIEFANGKVGQLSEAWWAGDGEVKSDKGEIPVRFEGMRGLWVS